MCGDGLRTLISDLFKGTIHTKRKIGGWGTDKIDRQILDVEKESMLNMRHMFFFIVISYVFTNFVPYIVENKYERFSSEQSYLTK